MHPSKTVRAALYVTQPAPNQPGTMLPVCQPMTTKTRAVGVIFALDSVLFYKAANP